ncbi:MAG: hypothetical protein P8X47_12460 [Ignavibacteriaceae bacterium]
MKNLFVIIVAFSFALIVGCQEGMINEPANSLEKRIIDVNQNNNVIPLCCQLNDPFAGICGLNGSVSYKHKVIDRTMNPRGLKEVALHLELQATLCSSLGMIHPEWKIKGISDDNINVSEDGMALLDKSYEITNRKDVVLLVRYLVTTDGIGVSGVSLVEIEN